jgi:hypothetical protein
MASIDFHKSPGSSQAEIAHLEEHIRQLAYTLFELCGRENGHDLDDWLFAEKWIKGDNYAA